MPSINEQLSGTGVLMQHVRRLRNLERDTGGPWIEVGVSPQVIPLDFIVNSEGQQYLNYNIFAFGVGWPTTGFHRKSGQVRTRGVITCQNPTYPLGVGSLGCPPATAPVFQYPPGYRPEHKHVFVCPKVDSPTGGAVRVLVDTDGFVYVLGDL